jgi:hypothetical protein
MSSERNKEIIKKRVKMLRTGVSRTGPGNSLEDIKNEIMEEIVEFEMFGDEACLIMKEAIQNGARWPGEVWWGVDHKDRTLQIMMATNDWISFQWAVDHGCPISPRAMLVATEHSNPQYLVYFIKLLRRSGNY